MNLRLRRKLSTGQRYHPEIDGCRFIAILWVVVSHWCFLQDLRREGPITTTILTGHLGVALFFAISGFILALPFAHRRNLTFKQYYIRRAIRIEPPFLICISLLAIYQGFKTNFDSELTTNFITTATYSHGMIYGAFSPINNVTWSLETEIQFYLIAPFLYRLYFRSNNKMRRMTTIAAILSSATAADLLIHSNSLDLSAPNQNRLAYSLIANSHFFLAGLLAADIFVNHQKIINKHSNIVETLSVITITVSLGLVATHTYYSAALALAFSLLLLAATAKGGVSRILAFAPITLIGGMCYTIYLYHFHILRLIDRIEINPLNASEPFLMATGTLLVCVIVFVVSIIPFVYLERPFMARHSK